MRPDDRIRLQHMVEAAEAVLQVIDHRTRQDMDTDLMLRLAVVRAVEVFGEAAAAETRQTH